MSHLAARARTRTRGRRRLAASLPLLLGLTSTVAAAACHVQYHYGASARLSQARTSNASREAADDHGRDTGAFDPPVAPTAAHVPPELDNTGALAIAYAHFIEPGFTNLPDSQYADDCLTAIAAARKNGAVDASTVVVKRGACPCPQSGDPTRDGEVFMSHVKTASTLKEIETKCRAVADKANVAQTKANAELAARVAPYKKVMGGKRLDVITNWMQVTASTWEIVGRDCVPFATPAQMATATVWYSWTLDTERQHGQSIGYWYVERLEWKGDALVRDVEHYHRGVGGAPPAQACR